MEMLPTVELLESTHCFPGTYMFKVIGRGENGFAARVVAAVRAELEGCMDPPYKLQETPSGRHVSVTVEPMVETGAQVLAIYRRIRDMDGLVTLF